MNISVSQVQGQVTVTVIKVDGQLDGQTYQDLINKAREAYKAGWRDFLVDMSDLTYISSAGLVALHSMALLLQGEELPDTDSGWSAYRSRQQRLPHMPGLMALTGTLQLGAMAEPDGRRSMLRLLLDDAVSAAFANPATAAHPSFSAFMEKVYEPTR